MGPAHRRSLDDRRPALRPRAGARLRRTCAASRRTVPAAFAPLAAATAGPALTESAPRPTGRGRGARDSAPQRVRVLIFLTVAPSRHVAAYFRFAVKVPSPKVPNTALPFMLSPSTVPL